MPLSDVTGRQIKAGRALLGWKRAELAAHAGVTADDVRAAEADATPQEALNAPLAATRVRLADALADAGIAFTNGGSQGVMLRPRSEGLRPEDLNASNDD
ncbi:helix-turn-helix domain-containing protein [Xanthobacter pseudotagetidis]|uniref:helix-turn-helix domain-containing protein n=1 Tax=Xanthobacter pseudotagetidis TaxID=3119911 RepID=UPI00372CAEB3